MKARVIPLLIKSAVSLLLIEGALSLISGRAGTKKLPPFNEEKKFTVFKSLGKSICVLALRGH